MARKARKVAGVSFSRISHNHQAVTILQRIERLAAEGMALHQPDIDRPLPGLAAEEVDQRPSAVGGNIDLGQVVVALGDVLVDRVVMGVFHLDHVAIGREGGVGQRLRFQDDGHGNA